MRSAVLALALIFALVICAAGSDTFLPGNPPLTNQVVYNVSGVLEWLAGNKFSRQQRDAVQQMLIQSWQQNNATQISQWVQISNLRPQLDVLNPNQKQTLRQTFLAQMRREQSNPLTAINPSGPLPVPAPLPAGGGSPELLGKWEQKSGSSAITYVDRSTGSYAAPTGNINRYTFLPNNEYEYAELSQVSNYNCTTGYFGYERGIYSVTGNRITFTQRQHSLEFKSTCNPGLNSNRNLPLETATYSYEIGQGQYGRELVVTDGKTAKWRFTHPAQ